ncbi:TPA: hypothetical protein ACH9ZX_000844, partial [Escherichia coli]
MVIPDQSNQSNSLSVSTFGGSILVALNWCGYPQGTKVLNKRSNLYMTIKSIVINGKTILSTPNAINEGVWFDMLEVHQAAG